MKGLEYAKKLAREFRAKLILLHSIALQYYVASDEYARYDLPLLLEQIDEVAKQQMRDLVQQTNWNGIELETSIQIGHAGQQICAEATARNADLIAISTHGRTGFEHCSSGSTAEYVVRHASCPVLVVPSRERALPKSATARYMKTWLTIIALLVARTLLAAPTQQKEAAANVKPLTFQNVVSFFKQGTPSTDRGPETLHHLL